MSIFNPLWTLAIKTLQTKNRRGKRACRRPFRALLALAFLVSLSTRWATPALAAVFPPLTVEHGAIATDHPLASNAGLEILRRGGNAVDAACAAAFALGVVNPAGSGLGGGGFMMIKLRKHGDVKALDFRESAPGAADRQLFIRETDPPRSSRRGGLAVAVPGEVMGCAEAISHYGKLSFRRVIAPALALARRGFPTGDYLARTLAAKRKMLHAPRLARVFMHRGKPLERGQWLKRPRLAKTLASLAAQGPESFYRGWIARDLVESVRAAGGFLSYGDLKRYRIKWREPLEAKFRGYRIHGLPPPSSGGFAVIQALNILQKNKAGRFDLKDLGHNSSLYLHRLSEALKHVFADRARHFGDLDFTWVPLARLFSDSYARDMRRRIYGQTRPIKTYGSRQGLQAGPRDSGTSHISVIDSEGMAVALTTSINMSFGSSVVGQRSGIILNNTMDDFTTRPGKANAFGLRQSDANTIAPHKRPLSSMSPTLITRDGHIVATLGGSGGSTIITSVAQVALNILVFRLDAAESVSRARVHHQWLPNRLWLESEIPLDVVRNLNRRGHRTRWITRPPMPHTAVQLVVSRDGILSAASDPRKYGAPAGY